MKRKKKEICWPGKFLRGSNKFDPELSAAKPKGKCDWFRFCPQEGDALDLDTE